MTNTTMGPEFGCDFSRQSGEREAHMYLVKADRTTGEWLSLRRLETNGRPWTVPLSAWMRRNDNDVYHYDTAEIDGQTVAVQIEWVD